MRVGIDLVSVESVREAISTHAERYLHRVYTERELADCAAPDGVDPERLAARFAAKEAAVKVLRPGEVGMPLSAIEVRRSAEGAVGLELTGTAAELAREKGLDELALSISHDGGYATAVVIAGPGLRNAAHDPMQEP
jgi:holo-[acyl-carrier protein] synthase